MKNSLIYRFQHSKLTREELKELHDEVNRNEQAVLKAIEEDWDHFVPEEKIIWSSKHWDQLKSKIVTLNTEDQSANVFRLHWWSKVAATLLIITSVWFAYKSYDHPVASTDDSPTMITKVNDSNQPSIVVLKDGTKVTLTAHSSLSYYDNFNSKYRVVHLEGEAFFETDQANTRPFVVVSDNITSICRGKEFSISAFKNSDEINVTLASGQIEIAQNDRLNSENNKVAVSSCQRYSFNKSNQQYLIGQITDCEYSDKVRSMKKAASEKLVML